MNGKESNWVIATILDNHLNTDVRAVFDAVSGATVLLLRLDVVLVFNAVQSSLDVEALKSRFLTDSRIELQLHTVPDWRSGLSRPRISKTSSVHNYFTYELQSDLRQGFETERFVESKFKSSTARGHFTEVSVAEPRLNFEIFAKLFLGLLVVLSQGRQGPHVRLRVPPVTVHFAA